MVLNEKKLHDIILSEVNQNVRFNPTKAHVYNVFGTINKACFNGQLPMCAIKMINDKKYLGYFSYSNVVGNRIVNPTILINQAYQYTMLEFESVVAHEMIHYYLAYNGFDIKCKHGNEFHSLASKINASMGLQISDTVDVSQMTYQKQKVQISPQLLGYMDSYMNSLKQYLPQIKQESKNKGKRLYEFYANLYEFTENVIYALRRTISKRTLNEGLMQQVLPFSPIWDAVNGFKKYYNKTNNWIDKNLAKNGNNNQWQYANAYSNGSSNSLIDLLYNVYPNIKKEYQNYSMGLNSLVITNEFTILDDLKSRIDAEINNAQGTNP